MLALSSLALAMATLAAAAPGIDSLATSNIANDPTAASIKNVLQRRNVTLSERGTLQGIYLGRCTNTISDFGLSILYYENFSTGSQNGEIPNDAVNWCPPLSFYETTALGQNIYAYSPDTGVTTGFNLGTDANSKAVGQATGTAWNNYGLHMQCYKDTGGHLFTEGSTSCIKWMYCMQDN